MTYRRVIGVVVALVSAEIEDATLLQSQRLYSSKNVQEVGSEDSDDNWAKPEYIEDVPTFDQNQSAVKKNLHDIEVQSPDALHEDEVRTFEHALASNASKAQLLEYDGSFESGKDSFIPSHMNRRRVQVCPCLPKTSWRVMQISLRSHRGRYIQSEYDNIISNSAGVGAYEKFQVKRVNYERCAVSLKSHHGTYMICLPNGQAHANAASVGDYETWEVHCLPRGQMALKGHLGFLQDHSGTMYCNAPIIQAWEKFTYDFS